MAEALRRGSRITKYYSIAIFLSFIMPFVAASMFIYPQVDDYLFTEITHAYGFSKTQSLFYNYWLARYFSTALLCALNPLLLKSFFLYRCLPLLVLILLFISVRFLFRKFFDNTLERWQVLLATLTIIGLFLLKMPSTAEGIFWMTGSFTYTLAIPACIYFLVCIWQLTYKNNDRVSFKQKIPKILLASLLAVIIAGFNEVSMLTMMCLLGLIILHRLFATGKIDIALLFILAIFLVAFFVVIKSPGVNVRSQLTVEASKAGKFMFSVKQSIIYTARFLFSWVPVLILVSLFFLFAAIKKMNSLPPRLAAAFNVNPLLALILGPTLIFVGLFPGFWAQGFILPQRALNIIFFHFLLAWTYFLLSFANYFAKRYGVGNNKFPVRLYLLGLVILTFLIVLPNNVTRVYRDLFSGRLLNFSEEQDLRSKTIGDCKDSVCVVRELKNTPRTIFYADFFGDPYNLLNFCYASYYDKQGIVVENKTKNPLEPKYEKFKWKIPIGN